MGMPQVKCLGKVLRGSKLVDWEERTRKALRRAMHPLPEGSPLAEELPLAKEFIPKITHGSPIFKGIKPQTEQWGKQRTPGGKWVHYPCPKCVEGRTVMPEVLCMSCEKREGLDMQNIKIGSNKMYTDHGSNFPVAGKLHLDGVWENRNLRDKAKRKERK